MDLRFLTTRRVMGIVNMTNTLTLLVCAPLFLSLNILTDDEHFVQLAPVSIGIYFLP